MSRTYEPSSLHKAVTTGTLSKEGISSMLDYGLSIDQKDQTGKTPLYLAVSKEFRRFDYVQLLLDFGADVTAKDNNGNSPLHGAVMIASKAQSIQLDIVEALLTRGADVNAVNNLGCTALTTAIRQDSVNLDLVRLLLRRGANPNQPFPETSLFVAFKSKIICYDLIKILIDAGANVETKFQSQLSLLHYALKNPQCDAKIIVELVSHGLNINERDLFHNTPLHFAIENRCNISIVEALLKAGADVNAETRYEITPLHTAAMSDKCSDSLVRLLISYGANVNAKCGQGLTPLLYALQSWNTDSVITELLKNGANPNTMDLRKLSALHYAVEKKDLGIVRVLLESGADVNCGENYGRELPLEVALRPSPNIDVIMELLNSGARFSSEFSLKIPLKYILQGKSVNTASVVRALLKNKDSKYLWDCEDLLCAALANDYCSFEAVEELFKYGIDLKKKNSQGKSALELELEKSKPIMKNIEFLMTHRAFAVEYNIPWEKAIETVFRDFERIDAWPFLKLLIKYGLLQKFYPIKIPSIDPYSQIDVKTIHEFSDKCSVECEKLGSEWLPCKSLLRTIIMSDKQCDDYCQNFILQLLLRKEYTIYLDAILHKIERSKLVEKLLNQVINFPCNNPFPHNIIINSDCVRIFEKYLTKETLYNLLTVFLDQH